MLLLLASLVYADTLQRPSRGADADGECSSLAALQDAESRPCASVSVPPATWAWALETDAYARGLEVVVVTVEVERDAAQAEATDLRVDLAETRRRVVAARWEGAGLMVAAVVVGSALTLGAAWAVGEVAQ